MADNKIAQETVVKESKILPPRELDTSYHIETVGNKQRVVAEQELIERRHREIAAVKRTEERKAHRAEWENLDPAQVLMVELLKQRPKLKAEPTFSIHPNVEGDIDVHLYGNVHRVLKHVVKHSQTTLTWHITAKGVLDRLRRMAVQPSRPLEVNQSDIYQEQADILRELARVAGILEEGNELSGVLEACADIKDPAIRWKTEVNTLFIHLRKRLGELACQTSQPPHSQPQETPEPPQKDSPQPSQPRRRRRRRAAPTTSSQPQPPSPSESVSAAEDSPTTSA